MYPGVTHTIPSSVLALPRKLFTYSLWAPFPSLGPATAHIYGNSSTNCTRHRMLLRRIRLIGSFVFHGGAATRACAGFSSSTAALQQVPIRSFVHQRTSTSQGRSLVFARHRVATAAVTMSSTSAPAEQTKVVAGIRELCDRYDGFILDQFGVLHGKRAALSMTQQMLPREVRSSSSKFNDLYKRLSYILYMYNSRRASAISVRVAAYLVLVLVLPRTTQYYTTAVLRTRYLVF